MPRPCGSPLHCGSCKASNRLFPLAACVIIATTRRDLARVMAPAGRRCVLVPTMGALHKGHAALITQGASLARERGLTDGCVVSIFVNPTQFNDPSDFDRYPRTLEKDLALCEAAGASIVYAPAPADVYPASEPVKIPALPDVATTPGLEDAHRPGHFAGVCQVVKRLFDIVTPEAAVFGEKDWQQLAVVRAMTKSLRYPIEIVGAPTVREKGGLAMSSRNVLLSPESRERALCISEALCNSWAAATPAEAEAEMRRTLASHGVEPEYAVVRHADTLLPIESAASKTGRALIAAKVGGVRLIDNVPWRARE